MHVLFETISKVLQDQERNNELLITFFSPAPDVEWFSPQNQTINETLDKYEIRDFGRELIILHAEPVDEGYYFCEGKVKSKFLQEKVFFNVTCTFVDSF